MLILKIIGLSAFIMLLLDKWGLIEYCQMHAWGIFNRLCRCNFCMSFWVSLSVTWVFACIAGDPTILIYAFVCTPIVRYIV